MYTGPQLTFDSKKDGISYVAVCRPPDPDNRFSWSLASFYTQEDADRQKELGQRIASLASEYNTRKIYGPSVAEHSAHIAEPKDLDTRINLPNGVTLFRNKHIGADGVAIKPGEGFIMSGAGCPVVVASGKGLCVPMHASRDSLIDMERIRTTKPSRKFESVIDAAVKKFDNEGIPRNEIRLRGGFNIKPNEFAHPFAHPAHGYFNEQMYDDIFDHLGANIMEGGTGFLDLPKLIEHKARSLRLKEVGNAKPLPPEYAHTRRPGPLASKRNIVFVARLT